MPLRCVREVWSMIKRSQCKTDFLLWSAVSKSSLGMERRRLKSSLPQQYMWLDMKRIPTQEIRKLFQPPSQLSSQLHHSVMFSCIHKLYIPFSSTKIFLIHKPFWVIGLKLGFNTQSWWVSTPARRTKCQIIAQQYGGISTTQTGLGNSLVLLLSENIIATHNKYEWETGKPKNVEISANLGMWKVALKSICATFSSVTPPPLFYWFLKSWCQVQLENAIYSKFWLILNVMRFFTDLAITEIAIFRTLWRFEGCFKLEVEGKREIKAIHSKPDFLLSYGQFF